MDSKVFRDEFLVNEDDDDILDMQYVIISNRIRKRDSKYKNIALYYNILYPNTQVLFRKTEEDFEEEYYKQLEENIAAIVTLVMACIDEGFNITFITTHREMKLGFLQYLADFIYNRLGYPVYDYTLYANKRSRKMNWNKKNVKKQCEKILKKFKKERYRENLKTEKGREQNTRAFACLSKKEMIKELKSRNLYRDGMSKADMVEMYELFM